MATINKKLIHFKSEAAFENAKGLGQIKDTSIVFVGNDAKNDGPKLGTKIYTHGETFYTSYTGENGVDTSNPGIIKNTSDNILFFSSSSDYSTFISTIGGEDKLPIPCVILISDEDGGTIIYNKRNESSAEDDEETTI